MNERRSQLVAPELHPEEQAAAEIKNKAIEKMYGDEFLAQQILPKALEEMEKQSSKNAELQAEIERLKNERNYIKRKVDLSHQTIAELEKLAMHDPKTGLLNDIGFAEMMDKLRERGIDWGALAFLDLDNFKEINDSRGHQFGDQVLATIAEYLKNNARPSDLISRRGGDEFLLFFPKTSVADILKKFNGKITIPFEDLNISMSGGMVEFKSGEDIKTAEAKADHLLYEVKKAGRGFLKVEDPQESETPTE